jgi:predicted TPR repeat methyltransferase
MGTEAGSGDAAMRKAGGFRPHGQNAAAVAMQTKFRQGLALHQQGKLAEAERICGEVLRQQPNHFDALHLLGVIAARTRRTERAVELISRAIKLNAKVAAAHSNLGNALMDLKRPEEALASCDKAIALKSDLAEAYNNRGNALTDLKRYADALASYDKTISLKPDYAEAYSNRGNALTDLKRPADALASYDKAIVLKPDYADAYNNRGNPLMDMKRYADALASYDKAISLKPDYAEAYCNRSNALRGLKRPEEALASCDKAIALKSDYAEAYYSRGNPLMDMKRYADALASYDKAISLKPNYAEAYCNRGNALRGLKRPEEALASCDKAITLKPDLADAWLARGESLVELKRAQESIIAYRQALKLGGDFELIKYNLAALGDEPPPIASPARYIADLFDSYADKFDRHLIENLKYGTPTLLTNAIKQIVSSNALDILDLGCGTGLVGECLHPLGRTLTGVDLSRNMLEKARQREIYDQLICSELIEFLHTQDKSFDLVVAADVFVYIGDLSVVFREVRRVLRDSGLFCFSVEATGEGNFVLRSTRRYAHSIDYLQNLAKQNRFVVNTIEPQIIRQDFRENVNGYHAIMRCC